MQQLIDATLMPLDPGARIFWPFLLISLVIILLWSGRKSLKDFLSPSSLLDVKILSLNLILKTFLFPLLVVTSFQVSVPTLKILRSIMPGFTGFNLNGFEASLLATLVAFIVNDFFRFFHHYLMHRLSFLRLLHRTHHSALVLTPLTLYRSHPLESLLASFRNILSIGLSLGIYSFLIQRAVTGLEILGVNLFGFIFNALLANLRHSSVPISFGLLEYIFVSPRMHQVHHSNNPQHYGKNYGVALALWDQLFGSFYRPSFQEMKGISYGVHKELDDVALVEATTIRGALFSAFKLKGRFLKTSSLKPIIQKTSS